ncbi:S1C family serine protease [Paractinoplanes rhizophilus]|uniref:S1C family serine protease n=1 Tax=Paractinoplanes rhizophilus TaxID=1416877 RepID=A0ABW2HSN0_9ACTN
MTTTYDPFIPADGADQGRYDGRRRAEDQSFPSRSAEYAQPAPRWQPEPRWEPADQPWEPVDQRWGSVDPRGEPVDQRWAPEPPRHPRSWQSSGLTGTFPVAEPEPERARAGRGRVKPLLTGLVAVLVAVAGWQAYRIESMNSDNATLHSTLAAEKNRTDRLEKQLAGVFDPEAVSSKVLPSVFRVRAGSFTGTAWSVGSKAADGQANLFTNYHVVADVWTDGGKSVTLERGSTKIKATIVKVSKGKDLALLRADQEITGLATAPGQVKPGQQVVVVGAPLGLDDTVTTGVISAYRPDDPDGPTIQFDAPINPGNSGGPVVNANNQVVGLATAKAKDAEGIGLAIPVKTACATFAVC